MRKWYLFGSDLSVAADHPLVGGEGFEGHGAAGVEFLGRDADFGTETELGAVGEGGGGVAIDAGCIYFLKEYCGGFTVFANDTFAMA